MEKAGCSDNRVWAPVFYKQEIHKEQNSYKESEKSICYKGICQQIKSEEEILSQNQGL